MLTDKEFEDFARKRFEDYEKEAPVHNWNHIKSALQTERRSALKKRFFIVAAFILVMAPISWFTYKQISFQNREAIAQPSPLKPLLQTAERSTPEITFPSDQQPDVKPVPDTLATRATNKNIVAQQPGNLPGFDSNDRPSYSLKKPAIARPSEISLEKQQQVEKKLSARVKPVKKPKQPAGGNSFSSTGKSEKTRFDTGITLKSKGKKTDLLFGNSSVMKTAEKGVQEKIASLPANNHINLTGKSSLEEIKRKMDSMATEKSILIIPLREVGKDSSRLYRRSLPYSFGVYVSPRYSFIRSIPNVADSILIDQIHTENKFVRERMGYEAGLTINRTFHRKWMITSSLFFSQIKETLSFSHHSSKADSITWTNTGEGVIQLTPQFISHHRQYESTFQTVGLNLGASYYYTKNNNRSLYANGSFGFNKLIHGTTRQYEAGQLIKINPAPVLQSINYRFSFGVGYAQRISRKIELTFEPTISYFLRSSFRSQAPVAIKPYTLGLSIGVRIGN
jgi:hypothetical protein